MKKTTRRSNVSKNEIIDSSYEHSPRSYESNSSMSFKQILLALVIFVIGFSLGYLWNKTKTLEQSLKAGTTATQQTAQPGTAAAPTVTIDKIQALFSNGYMKFGDKNAKNLFVEISDPSCPYCHVAGGLDPEIAKQVGTQFQYDTDGGSYVPPVREMKKMVDAGNAAFVMLYSNGHGSGELAAQALYCAYDNNKFWEAHDLLMSAKGYELLNTTLERDSSGPLKTDKNMQSIADFLSPVMDASTTKNCLTSKKYASQIARDQQVAITLGFNGTPHFFVNATAFPGAVSFKDMQSALKQ